MVAPTTRPFTGTRLLSTSRHQVLCQALGCSREQGRKGLSKQEGVKKSQRNGALGEERSRRGHSKGNDSEARRDSCPWNERLAWLEWDARGEKGVRLGWRSQPGVGGPHSGP